MDLFWRKMLLPISVNLCCLDFQAKYAVAYICEFVLSWLRPWSVQLNLLSQTNAERIAEWNPTCLHYSLCSWRKSERVFPRDVFRLRDSSKSFFFRSYNTPFLSCKNQLLLFVEDISVPRNSWETKRFSKQFNHCYLIQFFWLVAKIAIIFSN